MEQKDSPRSRVSIPQRSGVRFFLPLRGEVAEVRNGSSRSMMRFLLRRLSGLRTKGAVSPNGATITRESRKFLETSSRDEAQPAFVTRNVFGNRRQEFFFKSGVGSFHCCRQACQNATPHFPKVFGPPRRAVMDAEWMRSPTRRKT